MSDEIESSTAPSGSPAPSRPTKPFVAPTDPVLRGISDFIGGAAEVRYACYVGTGFKFQTCVTHKGSLNWKFRDFLWTHKRNGREAAIVFSSEGGETYEVIRAHPDEYDFTHYVIDGSTGETVSSFIVERIVHEPNY